MAGNYNKMFSASQLEQGAMLALQKWFPSYLRALERELGLASQIFDTPENYTTRNSFDSDAGEPLPKIVVLSPGIIGTPRKKGDGKYSAVWRLGVGIATAAPSEEEADVLVKGYAAAAKSIMLENAGLDSIGAIEVIWTDETYVDLPIPNQLQQFKAVSLFFSVDIDGVAFSRGGPTVPDEPSVDYGQVEKVFVDLTKEDINA